MVGLPARQPAMHRQVVGEVEIAKKTFDLRAVCRFFLLSYPTFSVLATSGGACSATMPADACYGKPYYLPHRPAGTESRWRSSDDSTALHRPSCGTVPSASPHRRCHPSLPPALLPGRSVTVVLPSLSLKIWIDSWTWCH